MRGTWKAYNALVSAGLTPEQAAGVVEILERAMDKDVAFQSEDISNTLFDAGVEIDEQAEALTALLRHCFWNERFSSNFNPVSHKTSLVRSGLAAMNAEQVVDAIDPFVVVPRNNEVRASVAYALSAGQVVMCDFTHLRKPEMQKERRAIVVSPRSQNSHRRCVIVPVSMTPPDHRTVHHYEFPPGRYNFFSPQNSVWAICDHVYTMSYDRMWFVNVRRRADRHARLNDADLKEVLNKLAAALGIQTLTMEESATIVNSHAAVDSVDGLPTEGLSA